MIFRLLRILLLFSYKKKKYFSILENFSILITYSTVIYPFLRNPFILWGLGTILHDDIQWRRIYGEETANGAVFTHLKILPATVKASELKSEMAD